jgi:hypothetical protein
MTSSPKRPWFRFHLLTAVLMMLASALLMPVVIEIVRMWRGDLKCGGVYLDQQPYYALLLMGCALVVLPCGMISEYLIRRREARKP